MNNFTWGLALGLLLGGWIMLYFCNRYYRRKIWNHRERVLLAKYDRELARVKADSAKAQLEEDDALNQRIEGGKHDFTL